MNDPLAEADDIYETQIHKTTVAHTLYLQLEQERKSLYADLYRASQGTIADREAVVYSSQTWKAFAAGLAIAEASYYHELRMLDHRKAVAQSTYLRTKLEGDYIKRNR